MTDAGQQVPVERLLGQEPRRQKKWQKWLGNVAAWRDWSLPVKLTAVSLVPIILAVALGASVLSSKGERTDDYERIDSLMVLNGNVAGLLDSVQRERTETAAQLTKGSSTSSALKKARAAVDKGIGPMDSAAADARSADSGVSGATDKASSALDRLGGLREDVGSGKLDASQAIKEYSAITRTLLQLQGAVVARVSDKEIGGTPQALRELGAVKEDVSFEQALVGYGVARGSLAPSELNQVRTAEVRIEDRMSNFTAAATPAERALLDSTVSEPSSEARGRLVRSVLGELGVSSERAIDEMSENDWASSSSRVFDQLGRVTEQLSDQVESASNDLVSQSRTSWNVVAVLLGLALILAVVVVFVITRQLLSSLRLLRRSAMDVAEARLPAAVRDIQEGKGTDTSVEPVPVLTRDEVGEVARAFDAVHSQALRLAAEQAGMRTAYSSVFVNLSRRSQSLVQRQLSLIEQLERDEEDADQLAILFQLDHLATRMRRNNENLMMLSGSEGGRRSGRPISTADVLRAAVSEIEQYQRVVVQTPPTTKVVGHAASDLMRLIAELLDNATSFSPPEAQVTVATNVADNGSMTIDVLDSGIGMNEAEVAEANARMAEASSLAMVTSRRMGLFVVGRLASKHGIGVTLNGGKDIEGVRATVIVPPALVVGAGGGPLTSEIPIVTDPGELPRRRPGATDGLPSPRKAEAAGNGSGQVNGGKDEVDAKEISGTALFAPVVDGDAEGTPGTALPKRKARNGTQPGTAKGGDRRKGDDLPSGQALFKPGTSPLSDWWNATAAAESKEAEEQAKDEGKKRRETTPIFDEMLSVWFRTDTQPAESAETEDAEGTSKHGSWEFAADEKWRTVAEIAKNAEPATFTEAGLPRRRRGEQLLPGRASAEPVEQAKPSRASLGRVDLPARDPSDVRSRLSSFQRGVKRGKHQAPNQDAPAAKPQEENKQPEATDGAGIPGTPETTGVDLNGSANETTDIWDFSSDAAWKDAEAVANARPAGFTESGLPKRRRGEQLMPGNPSKAAKAAVKAKPPERDPNAMRGRLSSFQQGVRRGRQNAKTTSESKSQNTEEPSAVNAESAAVGSDGVRVSRNNKEGE